MRNVNQPTDINVYAYDYDFVFCMYSSFADKHFFSVYTHVYMYRWLNNALYIIIYMFKYNNHDMSHGRYFQLIYTQQHLYRLNRIRAILSI